MKRRAYSYKRFSSPKQMRGDSMRRQTEFEQRVVAEMDLVLDDTLDLSDTGVSAFRGKNARFGALAEFMKLVETGRIPVGSVLIVENLDRLSRENVLDAFNLFSRIIGAGITLVTAEPYNVYTKASVQGDVAQLMVPIVYMMRAHDESKTKSHRISQAWGQRRKRAVEQGLPLTEACPRWLKVVGKRKYEVIEDRAQVVRDIYAWVREGLGVTRVIQRLKAEGVPCFGKKGEWHAAYVRKLLIWPAVYGEMQPQVYVDGKQTPTGDPVPGYFPAIISREEFDATRATMRDRKGKDGRPAKGDGNLFTGIVWHAVDRCRMSLKSNNQGGKRYSYLVSNMVDKGAARGEGRQFPYGKFEEAVLGDLEELRPEDVDDRFRVQKKELDEQIERLSGELVVVDNRMKEVEGQMLDTTNRIPAGTLMKMLTTLTTQKDAIVAKLAPLQAQATNTRAESLGEVKTILTMMKGTPEGPELAKYRRKVRTRLRWLVEVIWVHVEKVNHTRQFAHIQLFLRNGTKRDVIARSFEAKDGRKDVMPARHFRNVDFRTYAPKASVGKGKLREVERDRRAT